MEKYENVDETTGFLAETRPTRCRIVQYCWMQRWACFKQVLTEANILQNAQASATCRSIGELLCL